MTNKLPNGWGNKKLSEVSTVVMGQSPSSSSYNKNRVGLPLFQGKADFNEALGIDPIDNWTDSPTKITEPGSILMSVRAPVGDVIFNKHKACIGRGLASIKSKEGISQNYLYFYLTNIT